MARFDSVGFPLPSDEEWRFTPIGPIAETPFGAPPQWSGSELPAGAAFDRLDAFRLTFVNGRYCGALSDVAGLPLGVAACDLQSALSRRPDLVESMFGLHASAHALTDLNAALAVDAAVLHIPAGLRIEKPIHVVYLSSPSDTPFASFPRLLVNVGAGGDATLIESYLTIGGAVYWTNTVAEVRIEPNGSLDHYRLQQEAETAYHTGSTHVMVARDGRYTSHAVQLGGAISRHDLAVTLEGPGGACTLNGLYVGRGRQLMDNHTVIDHAAPQCESHELYKGVLNDRAHGVFNGKVFVRQDAQKTDAKQSNQALLLSDAAHVDTKPQLEIFADDVRCTHGATVGHIDAGSLFYLRSRGIPSAYAWKMLIHAFASDIIDRMNIPALRASMEEALLEALPMSAPEASASAVAQEARA